MWISNEVNRGFPPDFKVKYRFYTQEEGGRKILPRQGYRSDFALEEDFLDTGIELRVIHPEFEDENGDLIINETRSVLESGNARMWIMFPKARAERHIHDIKVGLKGYFMEGPRRVAEAEIIEIIGLFKNPRAE
ncbi:hypothetical protein PAECIP111891_02446 [Paenibacillus allorhizoplanae]|uniref:Uncharacterized protein n=1 Tax=Paenibacillus allorhizoplanae TaxID=2905648 RepID=A0ABM9C7F4_9BACL|nr:hypothetical protein [Paenibacillus allorhizoplanae]CAH1203847.1 hypothetical protein PAECIP111891_02446 [Paenibacillus allorhizoplanae]